MDMKRTSFLPKIQIIIGLIFFTLGLLLVLRENTTFSLFSQIFPDTLSTLIFSVILLLAGQTAVIFAVIKLSSSRILTNIETERQLTSLLLRNIEQIQNRMQNGRQTPSAAYNETTGRTGDAETIQTAATTLPTVLPANCRYCGAQIQNGYFCAKCGKAIQ
jgi:hypothetical protein